MVLLLRHLLGWVVAAFRSREDLILENLALRQQLLGSPRQTTSAATHCHIQAVLGRIAKTLGAMEEASHPGYTPNRCRLAWRRLSAVLEMALQSSTDRRPKSCQQRGSCPDFPDGRRESNRRACDLVGSRNSSWLPSNPKRLVVAASLGFPTPSNFLTIGVWGTYRSAGRVLIVIGNTVESTSMRKNA